MPSTHLGFFLQNNCVGFEETHPDAGMWCYHCILCQSFGEIKSGSDVCASKNT